MTISLKIVRQIFLMVFFFSFFCCSNAQTNNSQLNAAGSYFNNFQDFVYSKPNADSAFFYLKKLALTNVIMLRDLLHMSFAQAFMKRNILDTDNTDANRRKLLSKEILLKIMSDTTKLLQKEANPIYLLSQIQDIKNDTSALNKLTEEFINRELSPDLFYTSKTGIYGLMIYQIISGQPVSKSLSKQLFALIKSNLQANQITASDSSSKSELDKRAWYRYLYAYINYIEAKLSDNLKEKGAFLKTASDYSPDLIDRIHYNAYFYDMFFLFGQEKNTFKDDYLTFLTESDTGTMKVLSTLVEMALVEPDYKDKLKKYYNDHNLSGKDFNDYWMEAINKNSKNAPPILLNQIDHKMFSSKKLLGKWILIDFWGTWCGGCREEHPKLQEFYDSVILRKANYISLLTVACKDTDKNVLTYMKEKNYSFPVALSDNKIESMYSIQGYPTKILITPHGKYITVPFRMDWINFVKKYCDL